MILLHQDLNIEIWQSKPFLEKMANIGSEVFRANKWREINKNDADLAFFRSVELIDLTKANRNLSEGEKFELFRFKEYWCDYYLYNNIYNFTGKWFDDYFMWLTVYWKVMGTISN